MTASRREFLATLAASAAGAAMTSSATAQAPYQVSIQRTSGASAAGMAAGPNTPGVPIAFPSTMPMGSGAPLGGIGTGFVEIRADGCFYEWQIFNSGPWAQNARSTTAAAARGPQYLRFALRTKASDGVGQVRRLYLRSDDNDLYTLPYVQDVQSIEYQAWFPMPRSLMMPSAGRTCWPKPPPASTRCSSTASITACGPMAMCTMNSA